MSITTDIDKNESYLKIAPVEDLAVFHEFIPPRPLPTTSPPSSSPLPAHTRQDGMVTSVTPPQFQATQARQQTQALSYIKGSKGSLKDHLMSGGGGVKKGSRSAGRGQKKKKTGVGRNRGNSKTTGKVKAKVRGKGSRKAGGKAVTKGGGAGSRKGGKKVRGVSKKKKTSKSKPAKSRAKPASPSKKK